MGQRTRRRRWLREAPVAAVGGGGPPVTVIIESDERARRCAVDDRRPRSLIGGDHTRPARPRFFLAARATGGRVTGPQPHRSRTGVDLDPAGGYAARPGASRPSRPTAPEDAIVPLETPRSHRMTVRADTGSVSASTPSSGASRPGSRPADARVRVLVADGDPARVGTIVHVLGEAGMEAVTAYRGATALARMADEVPDVVIVGDGLGDGPAVELIPPAAGPRERVPTLALATHPDDRHVVALLDAGADDVINAAFRAPELQARVRALLRRGGGSTASPGGGSSPRRALRRRRAPRGRGPRAVAAAHAHGVRAPGPHRHPPRRRRGPPDALAGGEAGPPGCGPGPAPDAPHASQRQAHRRRPPGPAQRPLHRLRPARRWGRLFR